MSAPTRLFASSATVPAGAPANPSAVWTAWSYEHGDTVLSRTLAAYTASPVDPGSSLLYTSANGSKKCVKRGFYQLTNGHDFASETVKGVIKLNYNNGGQTAYDGNAFCTLSVRLFSSDFATERTPLLALTKDNVAASTGWINRVHPTATALASVNASANDWLVVEWGIELDCEPVGESGAIQLPIGNYETAQATETDGDNDGNMWIEFSGDLDAGSAPLAAGTATLGSITVTTVNATATDPTGGTAPYYYQWQRCLSGTSNWANVPGASSTTLADNTF